MSGCKKKKNENKNKGRRVENLQMLKVDSRICGEMEM
jgi:hypothetical protein